jgi:uncharacterized membrane protein YozB (DUF420 family)
MRKPPHSIRRLILPVGFAFTLASLLVLLLAWLPLVQSMPEADDPLSNTLSAMGLGFALIGLVAALIAAILSKPRPLHWMALTCASVVVAMWFICALASA